MLLPHLEQQEQGERLEGIVPAVHKVTHEDVVSVRHVAPRLEELEQVVELTVV